MITIIVGILTKAVPAQQTMVGFPRDKRSYQEAMNRPISIISYDPPLEYHTIQETVIESKYSKRYSTLINGNSDETDSLETGRFADNKKTDCRLLQNLSSGRGTTIESKDENTESLEMKNIDRGTSADTEHDEESALCPEFQKNCSKPEEDENQKPWQTLVSYVDELTLGGRKNSKGQYIDGMGSFPGFGKKKPPKLPPNCFPQHCYQR